nr:MAG TPA: hypothetical protein [Caudoviricetes sp.]DAO75254.1 MAG TPA: hypothetical protein [Bacteriophage sp.]DAU91668.1 MAG TPA: hypothetical protein [Caudoviricetes sp.]
MSLLSFCAFVLMLFISLRPFLYIIRAGTSFGVGS